VMASADDRESRRDLDRLVERLQLRRWTAEERSEYLADQDEHPMFMEALPVGIHDTRAPAPALHGPDMFMLSAHRRPPLPC
jgi:hypothetical protein